jgi:hypothetical protein
LLGKSSYACDRTISTLLRSFSHNLICTGELAFFTLCLLNRWYLVYVRGGWVAAYLICDILWDYRYLVDNTGVSILL